LLHKREKALSNSKVGNCKSNKDLLCLQFNINELNKIFFLWLMQRIVMQPKIKVSLTLIIS